MFLQGDKPTATLTRDRASRVLFDQDYEVESSEDTSVNFALGDNTNFAYDHNTTEFDQLVQSKYSHDFAAPQALTTEDVQYNKYFNADTSYDEPSAGLQQYYNDSNPVPQQLATSPSFAYQSFKPKVLSDFESVELGQKSDIDEALLQKIDEVQIYEPTAIERAEFQEDIRSETASEPYLKMNEKRLIACITFVAVTLLIITLVIMNSVAISGAGSQIRRLRDENTELQAQYEHYDGLRNQAWLDGVADATAFAEGSGSTPPTKIPLDSISSVPLAPANPDASTNLFNQIAKFLGSIFG